MSQAILTSPHIAAAETPATAVDARAGAATAVDSRSDATTAESPSFFDTYSLIFAWSWAFLVPGLALLNTQPFRTYDFAYVTYVTLPFLLGVLATFLTDSHDRGAALWTRVGILTPVTIVCGVGVMWTLALTVIPISPFLQPQNYAFTTPVTVALLFAIVSPLVWSVWRRVSRELTWMSALQIVLLLFTIGTAAFLGYKMFQPNDAVRTFARKDITIYITGALMWYLPSFGIAGGVWRKLDIV